MLELKLPSEVGDAWQWRSADGDLWHPQDMETRHLFFTIRMIWNHSVPHHRMVVGQQVKFYNFNEFYTVDYMKEAIRHLGPELMRRRDMKPEWWRELQQIFSWLGHDDFSRVLFIENIKGLKPPAKPVIGMTE